MKDEFSTLEIVKALRIPRERLREWMSKGFIKPSVPSEGQGKKAVFTLIDVYGVELFRRMVDCGMNRRIAGRYVDDFLKRGRVKDSEYVLIRLVDQGRFRAASIGPRLKKFNLQKGYVDLDGIDGVDYPVLEDWDVIHLINFTKLKEDVDKALSL